MWKVWQELLEQLANTLIITARRLCMLLRSVYIYISLKYDVTIQFLLCGYTPVIKLTHSFLAILLKDFVYQNSKIYLVC